jgi:hypothetical protein
MPPAEDQPVDGGADRLGIGFDIAFDGRVSTGRK